MFCRPAFKRVFLTNFLFTSHKKNITKKNCYINFLTNAIAIHLKGNLSQWFTHWRMFIRQFPEKYPNITQARGKKAMNWIEDGEKKETREEHNQIKAISKYHITLMAVGVWFFSYSVVTVLILSPLNWHNSVSNFSCCTHIGY